MDHKQQLALRPISTRRTGSVAGEVAAAMERSSLATASFRVYYSLRPGAVPFLWESKPGTPKSGAAGATAAVSPAPAEMMAVHHQLPPISPPPSSYHSSQLRKGRRCRPRASCQAAAGIVRALLATLGIRRRSHRRLPATLS
ncbi:hypothetical protein BDA96_01G040700 [Sorghum bicolor]|uniref:Uncharacterized protein n=2 Tax=Sorghum bicolor TaxID=4558 RepID=A0A921RW11_SORBI|nr:uncharacterized protein LOC8057386 [Sorghum bicolor]EER93211.1 hypothetical protein SORBI_3001G039200 [Sorghum bicolor]KAG0546993.1 hypothetical protein BDA96_01G040700 [Sorghum bicolor]|eukprot:XP_021307127.1 uncharacterized protein LOC8057386 [Sorghum bicolor]